MYQLGCNWELNTCVYGWWCFCVSPSLLLCKETKVNEIFECDHSVWCFLFMAWKWYICIFTHWSISFFFFSLFPNLWITNLLCVESETSSKFYESTGKSFGWGGGGDWDMAPSHQTEKYLKENMPPKWGQHSWNTLKALSSKRGGQGWQVQAFFFRMGLATELFQGQTVLRAFFVWWDAAVWAGLIKFT